MNGNATHKPGDPDKPGHPSEARLQSESGATPSGERTEKAESGPERARAEATRAAETLQREGEDIAATARDRAMELTHEQKQTGARHVEVLARAVGRAAEELEQSSPQLARHARDAASGVGRFSDALRDRSLGELINDVNGYAKREPTAFFAAALATGFALSRFLKSSGKSPETPPMSPHAAGDQAAGGVGDVGADSAGRQT